MSQSIKFSEERRYTFLGRETVYWIGVEFALEDDDSLIILVDNDDGGPGQSYDLKPEQVEALRDWLCK